MADGAHQEKPISLFYSYSHRDEALRGELEAHLSFLRQSKLTAEWHDRMIGAGDEWKGHIDRQLAAADIILLLVSADFLASDYCCGEEMTKALERHQLGEARVIPVILRPCQWRRTPLGSLQAVPKDGKPVSEWPNHDTAFNEIATAIERTIADLQQQRRRAAEQIQTQAQEARRRAEAEARQAAKEQKREAQLWREQDETETARMPKAAYNNDARKIAIWLLAAIIISAAGAALILPARNWFTPMERNAPAWTEPTPPTTSVSPISPEADKTREEPTQTQPGENVPPPERSAKQLRPPSAPTEPTREKPGKQLPRSSQERDRASLLCGDILHRRQLGEVLSDEDLRYLKECQ